MEPLYYIGLDVHKRKISYCVKDGTGKVCAEGSLPATRLDLDHWMKTPPQPWSAAMVAAMFTGWIYDHLQPHAAALKVARDRFGTESDWRDHAMAKRHRAARAIPLRTRRPSSCEPVSNCAPA